MSMWNAVDASMRTVWRALVTERLFTMIACVAAATILLAVPQVSNLVWQLPPLSYMSDDWPFYAVFYLYVVVVVALFGVLLYMLIPMGGPSAAPAAPVMPVGGQFARVAEVLILRVEAHSPRRNANVGAVLLAAGAAWYILGIFGHEADPGVFRWLHDTGLGAILAIMSGSWVAVAAGLAANVNLIPGRMRPWLGRFIAFPPSPANSTVGRLGYRMNIAGRLITIALFLTLVDAVIWNLPWWLPSWTSFRTYTIWAAFLIAFVLVGSGRVIDAWHRSSTWNVRVIVAALIIFFMTTVPSQKVGRVAQTPPVQMLSGAAAPGDVELISEAWFDVMENRLNNLPEGAPVIFVAASGGGSRAAMFTTMVLEALRTSPGKFGDVTREPVVPNFFATPGPPPPAQASSTPSALASPSVPTKVVAAPCYAPVQPAATRMTDAVRGALGGRAAALVHSLQLHYPEEFPPVKVGASEGFEAQRQEMQERLERVLRLDATFAFLTMVAPVSTRPSVWAQHGDPDSDIYPLQATERIEIKALVQSVLDSRPLDAMNSLKLRSLALPPSQLMQTTPKLVRVLPAPPDFDPPLLNWPPRPGENPSPPPAIPRPSMLSDHVALISSVSGGSLATAYYLNRNFPHFRSFAADAPYSPRLRSEAVDRDASPRKAWRSTYQRELFLRLRKLAGQKMEKARNERPKAFWNFSDELLGVVERVEVECVQLANQGARKLTIAPWLPDSAALDDMGTDFMAPLLRGALDPALERGVGVSRFWEERFGWDLLNEKSSHWRTVAPPISFPPSDDKGVILWPNDAPAALFNSCDVESGSRLIVGFPPLPPSLISDRFANPTRGGPYSITDLGDWYYSLSLAEAVRLSANFPWAFEVAEIPLRGGADTRLALDGGIVDNSGIDSLIHLIRSLVVQSAACERYLDDRIDDARRQAESEFRPHLRSGFYYDLWADQTLNIGVLEEPDKINKMNLRSFRVVRELRRRGVVVLHIDSGAKRVGTGGGLFSWLASVFPTALRPFQGLNNASYTNADLSAVDYDVVLGTLLRPEERSDRKPTPEPGRSAAPPIVQRVQLVCNNSENIMTAWSLGPEDKAQVILQFLIEWVGQEPSIHASLRRVWETVQAYRDGDETRLAEIERNLAKLRKGRILSSEARKQFYNPASAPVGNPAGMGQEGHDAEQRELRDSLRNEREKGMQPQGAAQGATSTPAGRNSPLF